MNPETSMKSVQAVEKYPSIEAVGRRLRRSIIKDRAVIKDLEAELSVSGDPLDYLDRGLRLTTPDRVYRLLEDHPRFEQRVKECLQQASAVLRDEGRQAARQP